MDRVNPKRNNPLRDPSLVLGKSWKKLKRLHPMAIDLERVSMLRTASIETLTDTAALEELIVRLGLNDDGLEEFPAFLHGCCGQGLRIWQYPIQFAPYLVELSKLGIRSYLELGVRHGGTFVATVEYLMRFGTLERAVAVDIMPCPTMDAYRDLMPCARFERFNTQSPEFANFLDGCESFDLALIDANHDEREARREVELVKPRARILALHDIDNGDFPGIARVWSELVDSGHYDCTEFVLRYEGVGPFMGIGLARRRRNHGA